MITGHLPELVLLLVIALVFFGPKRLPEMGEAMGTTIRNFKKGVSELHEASLQQEAQESGHVAAALPASSPAHVDATAQPVPVVEVIKS